MTQGNRSYPAFQSPVHFALTSYHFRRSCQSKIHYISKEVADVTVASHKEAGDDVESYQCRYCGDWHVGHPVKHNRHNRTKTVEIDTEDNSECQKQSPSKN